MMKKLFILIAVVAAASCAGSRQDDVREVTIPKEVLMDKIKGGWAGKIIGCTYGGPTEFKYRSTLIRDYIQLEYSDTSIMHYMTRVPGLYDDIYMDLTFVEVFDRLGLDAPVDSFAVAFANAGYQLWHANLRGRVNILNGIMPPASGHWKNNPHADDIDFQIESDYAGLMAPGMVNAAAHYCDGIGHIMNYGDGYYGGLYVAAMLSLAFVYDDVETVCTEALRVIPAESKYYRCIQGVIDSYHRDPDDWKQAWFDAQRNYGESIGCPSGVYGTFNIDAVINSAHIVIGLLFGHGDFERTIDISTRCGDDSDCNPSSAGGILGVMLGYSNIDEKWRKGLDETADMDFAYTSSSFNDASEMSYRHALEVIALNGGSVEGDNVVIRTQRPEAVPFEKSFEGLRPADRIDLAQPDRRIMEDFDFEGSGVVVMGDLRWNTGVPRDKSYTAEIEVTVDGEFACITRVSGDIFRAVDEFYVNYDLAPGRHHVAFRWLNPLKGATLRTRTALVYVAE